MSPLGFGRQCLRHILFKTTSIKYICGKHFSDLAKDVAPKIGPLSGIRIIDLTRVLAGPFCTMILGDLGAEIIKIERPGHGDETRLWGPPFVGGESCYFLTINRNKKSIVIDIKKPEGCSIIKELVKKSDILVENYIPGTLDNLGLGYSDMNELNARLVYCSITGFGDSGPYCKRSGYDVIAASVGGLMHITGPENGEPCKIGVAMTDLATALYAHGAIMASLLQRDSTGKGQKINCDLLSTQVSLLVNLASNYLNAGKEAKRWGTAHESIVPYQAFKTADGYLTVAAGTDEQFVTLCKITDMEHLLTNTDYKTNQDRVAHRVPLLAELTNRFRRKTTQNWLNIFEGSGIPYGPINSMQDVFEDPQVQYKKMVAEMTHPKIGNIKVPGPAVEFSMASNEPRMPPPCLGEHTDHVLMDILGMTREKVDYYKSKQIIA